MLKNLFIDMQDALIRYYEFFSLLPKTEGEGLVAFDMVFLSLSDNLRIKKSLIIISLTSIEILVNS
jgi:hypothetical protein